MAFRSDASSCSDCAVNGYRTATDRMLRRLHSRSAFPNTS
eukprot:CAMPEP_0119120390 /NCGR_PEP_ID=MMETSP1310-20130426/1448_1 /TAXON_ID=464262 /ORGANISM="Genus nov. species nov., Strain RCC2339" /LENGTH=39 /DNA_ID= /DNA_START= /DNA_END= /DNA_ORIENTATION=